MWVDAERDEALRRFARDHGFDIKDVALFDRALTHASMAADGPDAPPDYESLEFLGDAVLGLAAAHYLFQRCPGRTPGEYTRLRAGLVNRDCVARVGDRLGIAPLVRLGRGEEMSGGRQRKALISDCMEALIGALYLDSGWEQARTWVVQMFDSEFARVEEEAVSSDYKSRLQELCQSRRLGLPQFEVIEETGPDHRKEFVVAALVEGQTLGQGKGGSKKEAQQQAAQAALQLMEVEQGESPGAGQ